MPTDGSSVTFTGYWASGYGTVYKTSNSVTLTATAPDPTHSPTRQPTAQPTVPVPTYEPSPQPTYGENEPTPEPTIAPTPDPTRGPTFEPTYLPSETPTRRPTQATNSYSVSMTVTLNGLDVNDITGDESSIESLIANELGVAASRVVILKSFAATRRRLLSRMLSSASTIEFQVTDFSTSAAAVQALSALETYIGGETSFVSDLNSALGTSATGATVDESGTVDSSLDATLAKYEHSCALGNGEQHIYWKVSDDRTSVSTLLHKSGSSVSNLWVALGLVPDAATSMVASEDEEPHKVYLYKPSVPSAALYDIKSYSSEGFSLSSTVPIDGVTGIDVVESGDNYVFLAYSHSVDTKIGATSLTLESGSFNRLQWAAGAAPWPSSHRAGTYGFVDVYWMDGQCSALSVEEPSVPLAVVLIPLLLAILLGSRLSFLRVWADRRKDGESDENGSWVEGLLLLRTWRSGRLSRLPSNLFSSLLSEPGAWLFGMDSARAAEYSIMGYLGVILHLALNVAVVAAWHASGSSTSSLSRAFGAAGLMNFWVALIPTAKGSIVLYLTGVPFERAVKYHRIATTTGAFFAFLHLILNFNLLDRTQLTSSEVYGERGIRPVYGLLAWWLMLVMTVVSISYAFRRLHHRIFIWVHQLWLPTIFLLMLHVWMSPSSLASGFIPGLFLQILDKLWRMSETLFTPTKGTIRAVLAEGGNDQDESKGHKEDAQLVVLSIPRGSSSTTMRTLLRGLHDMLFDPGEQDHASSKVANNTRATMESFDGLGQYYFINIPRVSLTEWHPISVSQRGEMSPEGTTTFHIRAIGPWTQALARLATDGTLAKGDIPINSEASPKEVGVALDGPHGSLHIDLSAYSDLVLFAGGIGITHVANILERVHALNSSPSEKRSQYPLLKRVTVVWVFKQTHEAVFVREFGDKVLQGSAHGSRSTVYSTAPAERQSSSTSSSTKKGAEKSSKNGKSKKGGYALTATREDEFAISSNTAASRKQGSVRIDVKCFSTSGGGVAGMKSKVSNYTRTTALGAVISIEKGRPAIHPVVTEAAAAAVKDGGRCGVVCCGPRTLSTEVSETCSEMRDHVDFHIEAFEY